ncbi:MAG: DEAD/DEAH box helicase [Actinobacteria bacterium]|nr:DEAD/DEAH box helicase [Actinomycetota bacterium]
MGAELRSEAGRVTVALRPADERSRDDHGLGSGLAENRPLSRQNVGNCYCGLVGFGRSAAREVPFPPCALALWGCRISPKKSISRSTQIATFADLGISKSVVDALRARSITEPFPVQKMVIGDALAGHDLLVQSPTGSGKTLAFGLPLVDLIEPGTGAPQALILAPTRELASQIVEELAGLAKARRLRVAAVYGGVAFGPQIAAARRADVLVATPGRLEDLIQRRDVELGEVEFLVLDEADRMLDMGFRPAVDRIVARLPRGRQTLFFSATLDGAAGQAAREYTRRPRSHTYADPERAAADIQHRFVAVESQSAKLDHLVDQLASEKGGRSLVFVRTKRGADRVVKRLRSRGVDAVAMHGDKSQRQREAALARFERGDVLTLVATDVAARGIDVPDVVRVINFDLPEDRAGYVHRVGRTGRAGRTGTGISFVLADQMGEMRSIASGLGLEFDAQFGTGTGAAATTAVGAAPPRGQDPAKPRSRRRRRRRRPRVAA